MYGHYLADIFHLAIAAYRRITFDLGAPTDVHAGRIGGWKTLFVLYRFAEASSSFSYPLKAKGLTVT
jgi:hypothetical protein